MRLDHLLSREYEEAHGCDHGSVQVISGPREGLQKALYSFERAREGNVQGQGQRCRRHLGGVAQLVEHLLCKQGVIGSNPFTSTRGNRVEARVRKMRAHSSAG